MNICNELRGHWSSQDDPELDDEDKCCHLLGLRAAAEIERLRSVIDTAAHDIQCGNSVGLARRLRESMVPNAGIHRPRSGPVE